MVLPTILSGPIVRRVEPAHIYIWIALSKPYRIEGELYIITPSDEEEAFEYELLCTRTKAKTMRLGERLYVSLIEILSLEGTFPVQTLLGYNLLFTGASKVLDLHNFNLLSPGHPHSIVYGNLKYPSFYINTNAQNTMLYGSCRKPHGKGEDALASADALIDKDYLNLEKRPSALFFLGDQIYADDVADPLFPFLSDLSLELMGRWNEDLSTIDPRLDLQPFRSSIRQIRGRPFIMEQFCKFTSKNAHNHLIRFSEYAAMYLICWGPQLWEMYREDDSFDSFADALHKGNVYFMFPDEIHYSSHRKKELEQYETRYTEQLEQISHFRQTLSQIRRILANTPTYMICDDHDITDDWNLSLDWKESVRNSPLGRHVIANGLAAYWAFQGWGNDPERFDESFLTTMQDYFDTFRVGSNTYKDWVMQLWNFDHWYYMAPTVPKALFLDTRTMRSYDPFPQPVRIGSLLKENIKSPQLISSNGWQKITEGLQESGWKSGDPLIIASPPPLYGIGLIESFLNTYISPLRVLGFPVQSTLDLEVWKYNETGFNEFLRRISEWNPSPCYILSGDVHSASSVKSHVQFQDGGQIMVHQFTSSPLHNMSYSGIGGALLKMAIGFNSIKRKRKEIHRYCNEAYHFVYADQDTPHLSPFIWKENIRYFPVDEDSIIETRNNLGLLTLSSGNAQNSLLR